MKVLACVAMLIAFSGCKPKVVQETGEVARSEAERKKVDEQIAARLKKAEKLDYCEHTWKQMPGYTDYTVTDRFLNVTRSGIKADGSPRGDKETLQEAGIVVPISNPHDAQLICGNAKVVKKCFDKAVKTDEANAPEFKKWIEARGLDPIKVRMAFAAQETWLGAHRDSGYNGVGMMQVITVIRPDGSSTSSSSAPDWTGITHNILTNMEYSSRVFEDKVKRYYPGDVYELALFYNAGPDKYNYSERVRAYYNSLKYCTLK